MNTRTIMASVLWLCIGAGLTYAEDAFHHSGNVRYFSAGVGLEERQATYPLFSLKLIFTAGGKPYLTGVEVAIRALNGGTIITIPKEEVEGPWLFLDLPTGTYDVTAAYGTEQQVLKGIKVVAGKQKTVYVRWTDDVSATVNALPSP